MQNSLERVAAVIRGNIPDTGLPGFQSPGYTKKTLPRVLAKDCRKGTVWAKVLRLNSKIRGHDTAKIRGHDTSL